MTHSLKSNIKRDLIVIRSGESIEEALMRMKNHHIRHLPVVNKEDEIIGFLSDRDLLRALDTEERVVDAVMQTSILKFDIRTPMRDLVGDMIKRKISAFLVTENGKTVGIITSEDMLAVLYEILKEEGEAPSLLEDFIYSLKEMQWLVTNPNTVL